MRKDLLTPNQYEASRGMYVNTEPNLAIKRNTFAS